MGKIYRTDIDLLSSGEKEFFEKVKKEHNEGPLSDWNVIFDLNIDLHQSKRDGQCDCLFIGPLGVFVVEIKGGDIIEFTGGMYRWGWKDGKGKLNESHEPPISQAKGNMYSIRKYLLDKIAPKKIDLYSINFGYAVAFPQANLNLDKFPDDIGIEQSKKQMIDIQTRSIKIFLTELAKYFKEKKYKGKKELKLLNASEISYITRSLQIELKSIVSSDIEDSENELIQLSKEQYETIDNIDFKKKFGTRLLVEGSAGTGKTVVAKYLAEKLSLEDKNVLWISFNIPFTTSIEKYYIANQRVVVWRYLRYLNSILKDNGHMNISPSKARKVFTQLINESSEIKFDKIGNDPNKNRYQMIIIDEAQDILDDTFLLFLDTMLDGGIENGNWAIFMDKDKQSGLFTEMNEDVYEELLKASNHAQSLNKNLRNATKIMEYLNKEEKFEKVECKRQTSGNVIIKDFRKEKVDFNKLIFDIASKEKFVTLLSPLSSNKLLSDVLNKDKFFDYNKSKSDDVFFLTDQITQTRDPKYYYDQLRYSLSSRYFGYGYQNQLNLGEEPPNFLSKNPSNKKFNDYFKIFDHWRNDKNNKTLSKKLVNLIDTIKVEEYPDDFKSEILDNIGLNFIPEENKNYYGVNIESIRRFKGLETHTLILHWPAYIEDDDNRGTLIYTALTRALNKAYIIKTKYN